MSSYISFFLSCPSVLLGLVAGGASFGGAYGNSTVVLSTVDGGATADAVCCSCYDESGNVLDENCDPIP